MDSNDGKKIQKEMLASSTCVMEDCDNPKDYLIEETNEMHPLCLHCVREVSKELSELLAS